MKTKRNLHRLTLLTLLILLLLNACSLFQPTVRDERSGGWVYLDNKGSWSGYNASSDTVYMEEGAPSLALGSAPPEPPWRSMPRNRLVRYN